MAQHVGLQYRVPGLPGTGTCVPLPPESPRWLFTTCAEKLKGTPFCPS